MKKTGLLLSLLVASLLTTASVFAGSTDAYGPESKKFGLGLYLGEPTGITGKGYIRDRLSIDGIVSWSFAEDSLTLVGDVLWDFFDIPTSSRDFTLPFYAGAGLKLGFDEGGPGNGQTIMAIRVPVGVAMQFERYPIEIFAELAPGIEMTPSSEFDLTGGLGARFYF